VAEVHSTDTSTPSKPVKPSADFPLFPHATRRWAKKIKGKLHYFGRWDDPAGALREFKAFLAGKPKPPRPARPSAGDRPAKPRPDFPLFPHATGRWAKKIRGRLVYFGKWDDPEGSEASYDEQKADLHAGRTPRTALDALTVFGLCGSFLRTKKQAMQSGDLSPRSYADYLATCKGLLKAFGKNRLVADLGPDDFGKLGAKLAKCWGPHRRKNEINRVRIVFNFAQAEGLLERAMVYGEGFKRPPEKVLRASRRARGPKMFEAAEVRHILKAAKQPLKAMILLGVNCGFGNGDVGRLPMTALDLANGWANYPRPKTEIDRRCPLWPETIAAVKAWLKVRPDPKGGDDAGLVFLTRQGRSWHKDTPSNPLSAETRKLLDSLGLNGHRNFYTFRHVFQTIGDESGDFLAVRSIMGHVGGADIANQYRERISDERLRKVAEHVRGWLFGRKAKSI
jgi:integrase